MNKYLRSPNSRRPTSGSVQASASAAGLSSTQPTSRPRSWRAWLILLAITFSIYSFFGQFLLPEPYRWSTISGNVVGGTEKAAIVTSAPAKIKLAHDTAEGAASGEIDPKLRLEKGVTEIHIGKQEKLNQLELKQTADKAPILADQAAMSAEATLYAQCLDRVNSAAQTAAAKTAGQTEGLGTTAAAVEATQLMVSMQLRQQCDEAKSRREALRAQSQSSAPRDGG